MNLKILSVYYVPKLSYLVSLPSGTAQLWLGLCIKEVCMCIERGKYCTHIDFINRVHFLITLDN